MPKNILVGIDGVYSVFRNYTQTKKYTDSYFRLEIMSTGLEQRYIRIKLSSDED